MIHADALDTCEDVDLMSDVADVVFLELECTLILAATVLLRSELCHSAYKGLAVAVPATDVDRHLSQFIQL